MIKSSKCNKKMSRFESANLFFPLVGATRALAPIPTPPQPRYHPTPPTIPSPIHPSTQPLSCPSPFTPSQSYPTTLIPSAPSGSTTRPEPVGSPQS